MLPLFGVFLAPFAFCFLCPQIVKYDHILSLTAGPGDEDKLQFNAFYQREVAAYTALRVDQPLTAFDLGYFSADFKENWGRVQNPGIMVQLKYEMQPLREALGVRARVTLSSLERSQPGYSFMLVRAGPPIECSDYCTGE